MHHRSALRLLAGALSALLASVNLFAVEPAVRTQALADAKAGKIDAATPVLEQLAAATPLDTEACSALADIRLAEKNTKAAVELMEKVVDAEPNRADYQSHYGQILGVRIGELSFIQQGMVAGQMLDAFEKSVEIDPKHVPGLIGLCRYYTNAPLIAGGSLDKAEAYAADLEKIDPVAGAVEAAMIAEKRSNWAGALGRYEGLAKRIPGNPRFQERCGAMLAKLGRTDEARAAFERALAINPAFPPAKQGLAQLCAKK